MHKDYHYGSAHRGAVARALRRGELRHGDAPCLVYEHRRVETADAKRLRAARRKRFERMLGKH